MKTFDFNRSFRETPMGQMPPSRSGPLVIEDISFRRLLEVMVDSNRQVWRPEARRDSRMQF